MHKYRLVSKKGEGTFSEVVKAQQTRTGKIVAIKRMKATFSSIEQVNSLREIQALRRLSPHPNIIKLIEVMYDRGSGKLALVFELMDNNIYELIRGRRTYVPEGRVQLYMYQLMKSLDHMHRNGIFHRDIKPENVLTSGDTLKLADFGSCRAISSKHPYTEYISTRWYRAPECLLTDGYYTYKMDIWGMGAVMFELITLYPLFPGTNEVDQLAKIHSVLGTPSSEFLQRLGKRRSRHMSFQFPTKKGTGLQRLLAKSSPECLDLLVRLLAYNPDERINARQALRHPYFRNLRELDKGGLLFNSDGTVNSGALSGAPKAPLKSNPPKKPSPPTTHRSSASNTSSKDPTKAKSPKSSRKTPASGASTPPPPPVPPVTTANAIVDKEGISSSHLKQPSRVSPTPPNPPATTSTTTSTTQPSSSHIPPVNQAGSTSTTAPRNVALPGSTGPSSNSPGATSSNPHHLPTIRGLENLTVSEKAPSSTRSAPATFTGASKKSSAAAPAPANLNAAHSKGQQQQTDTARTSIAPSSSSGNLGSTTGSSTGATIVTRTKHARSITGRDTHVATSTTPSMPPIAPPSNSVSAMKASAIAAGSKTSTGTVPAGPSKSKQASTWTRKTVGTVPVSGATGAAARNSTNYRGRHSALPGSLATGTTTRNRANPASTVAAARRATYGLAGSSGPGFTGLSGSKYAVKERKTTGAVPRVRASGSLGTGTGGALDLPPLARGAAGGGGAKSLARSASNTSLTSEGHRWGGPPAARRVDANPRYVSPYSQKAITRSRSGSSLLPDLPSGALVKQPSTTSLHSRSSGKMSTGSRRSRASWR